MITRDLDDCDTAPAVLSFVRARRSAVMQGEADQLAAAVTWAGMHSTDSLLDAAAVWVPGCEEEMAIAGPGAPLISEFSVLEFSAALGLSSDSGRIYLGHAVELAHRLPRVYERVQSLDLPVWKARRIAAATIDLPEAGAAFVDQHVASTAHKISIAQLDRVVEEARTRFDPAEALKRARDAAETRFLDIDLHQVSFDGCVNLRGTLDLADALDLEDAISRGATHLGTLTEDLPLDLRRSLALGDLARKQLSLDLNAEPDPGRKKPRQVVVHVHLADAAIARVENTRSFVSVDQVRTWCENADTQVVIKPVIDLAGHVHVDAYEVPDRLKERQALLQHSCVFPWCQRRARSCDHDHGDPASNGGPTCDCNIAPLCRRHHRAKTHTRWRYERLDETTFVWRSPHGLTFRRDHTGTTPQP